MNALNPNRWLQVIGAMFISHGTSFVNNYFVNNYIGKGEYLQAPHPP